MDGKNLTVAEYDRIADRLDKLVMQTLDPVHYAKEGAIPEERQLVMQAQEKILEGRKYLLKAKKVRDSFEALNGRGARRCKCR